MMVMRGFPHAGNPGINPDSKPAPTLEPKIGPESRAFVPRFQQVECQRQEWDVEAASL
jgi:hypothetical protein